MIPVIAGALALGSGGVGGGLLSSIGLGSVSSFLGSGGISSILSSTLSSVTSNPIGTISSVGSTIAKTIGGIFGGGTDFIMADRNDVVLGNGSTALAILYNHPAKQGGRILITEPMEVNDMFFDAQNWHDCISAIEVSKGSSIVFFEHPNFGGLFDGLNGDNMRASSDSSKNRPGTQNSVDLYNQWGYWNDRISSFKVKGQAVYETQKVSDSVDNIQNLGGKPMPTNDPINVSSNSYVDLPTSSATPTTESKSMNWLWVVLGLLGVGIYTKKIKL